MISSNEITKYCNSCNTEKPVGLFNGNGIDGYRYRCAECDRRGAETVKELKKIHGDRPPAGYSCPGCGLYEHQLPPRGQRVNLWDLDHDHGTGNFRGWLCHKCNPAAGNTRDSPRTLINLALYLEINGSYGTNITILEFTKQYLRFLVNRIRKVLDK